MNSEIGAQSETSSLALISMHTTRMFQSPFQKKTTTTAMLYTPCNSIIPNSVLSLTYSGVSIFTLLPCSQESKRSETRRSHFASLNYLAYHISVVDEMKRLISKYPNGVQSYEETLRVAPRKMAVLETCMTSAVWI